MKSRVTTAAIRSKEIGIRRQISHRDDQVQKDSKNIIEILRKSRINSFSKSAATKLSD